jgi:multisubunit Na+/H+ antiporter MnhB subunit
MTDVLPALYALLIFMLVAAVISVETRDLLSSILCLGAVGLALSVVDLVLKAPDLALTQLVVEIFAVVLLIRIVVTREDTTKEFPTDTLHVAFVGGLLVAFALVGWVCFRSMRPFGDPVMTMGAEYLRDAGETGALNRVMGVLLDFRAYDTLGEATVIFTAILGCYALLRTRGMKEGGPGVHSEIEE